SDRAAAAAAVAADVSGVSLWALSFARGCEAARRLRKEWELVAGPAPLDVRMAQFGNSKPN
ncbi:MAG TPA: hypothetical protein VKG61_24610, partial [Streptosporangiaceae bacterium]|nr:hypothetical protein [Streptosporangiaceae bacterium]